MKNTFKVVTSFNAIVNDVPITNKSAYIFLKDILPRITKKFNIVAPDILISAVDDAFLESELDDFDMERYIGIASYDIDHANSFKDLVFDSGDELQNFFENVNNSMSDYNGNFQQTEEDLELTF